MAGFQPPPPGSVPSGFSSPDMAGLDDVAQAAQGKMGGQNASSAQQAISSALGGKGGPAGAGAKAGQQPGPSRTIGTPLQEAGYLAKDVGKQILGFLPGELQSLLGIKSTDSPEDAAKKRQMMQNYQKMTNEQKQYVQKKLQEEQMEKRQKEEAEVRKKQFDQQKKRQIQVPQGKRTGEQAAGKKSNSNDAVKQLEDKRKKLSDPV